MAAPNVGAGLGVLAVALWMVLFAVAMLLARHKTWAYLRAYRARVDPALPLALGEPDPRPWNDPARRAEERGALARGTVPLAGALGTGRLLSLLVTVQRDATAEAARRRALFWWAAVPAVQMTGLLGFAAASVFS